MICFRPDDKYIGHGCLGRILGMNLSTSDQNPPPIDRAAVFKAILDRQALRRDARLPVLDVPTEYRRALELALWQRHVALHLDQARRRVLGRQRAKYGLKWPSSWGGKVMFLALVQRELAAGFGRGVSS